MSKVTGILVLCLAMMLLANRGWADTSVQDERAVNALRAMSDFIEMQDAFIIAGEASSDFRLPGGGLAAQTAIIEVAYREPVSMHFTRFDGADTDVLNIHDATLLYFDESEGYYAAADSPESISEALDYAFLELDIDLPLLDLVRSNTFDLMVEGGDEVLYLGNTAQVRGVTCHHVAIRSADLDVQLWIETGEQPLPRRVMLTDKWVGGAPRFVANLDWDLDPAFEPTRFEFTPPQDAEKIQFIQQIEATGGQP